MLHRDVAQVVDRRPHSATDRRDLLVDLNRPPVVSLRMCDVALAGCRQSKLEQSRGDIRGYRRNPLSYRQGCLEALPCRFKLSLIPSNLAKIEKEFRHQK